jgi:predicted DNA-binding ribbon-helix-helix protein
MVIGRHKTSITLEPAFWEALKEISAAEKLTPGKLIIRIDRERQYPNLPSAVRLYVLDHYRPACRRGRAGRQQDETRMTRDDGMSINVRLSSAQLESLDRWIEGLSGAKLSRAEAIRRLIDLGLSHAPKNGRLSHEARAKASAMAGETTGGASRVVADAGTSSRGPTTGDSIRTSHRLQSLATRLTRRNQTDQG